MGKNLILLLFNSIKQLITFGDICPGNQSNWGRKSIFYLYLREHLSSCTDHANSEQTSKQLQEGKSGFFALVCFTAKSNFKNKMKPGEKKV